MSIKANVSQLITVHHPGVVLDEKLKEMGMSIKEFALRVTKPEKTIIAVINGDSSITTEMAVSFEAVTKIPASFWLRNQLLYDEYVERRKREQEAEEYIDWMRQFPYAEMAKRGWVPNEKTPAGRVKNLLAFFGLASPKAWNDYYLGEKLKLAFRISLAPAKDPHAMSVWLRQGELQASAIDVQIPFNEKKLKATIPAIKQLIIQEPEDFFSQLQALCLSCGVILIATPSLPKAPINGATRWIKDTPVIQLSGRYKGYDHFWFNFFHEIGHILRHGKKDIFLESAAYTGQDTEKEQEANSFASETLIPSTAIQDILEHVQLSEDGINTAAAIYQTHPAIIVGRLKYLGVLQYWEGQNFNKRIDLFDDESKTQIT
jgi:addiction module HigA family antidote